MIPNSWLNQELEKEIRQVFEPRYKRKLLDTEAEDIAVNLTNFMEAFLKFKQRERRLTIKSTT